jgi:hypothetical protein
LNAANGQANRGQQRLVRSANRRHQNVVDRPLAGWAKLRLRVRLVVLRTFRRKVAARDLNVSDSALRCQVAPNPAAVLAENSERHLGYVIPAPRLLRAVLLAKRAAREKKVLPMVNLVGHREVERPRLRSTARASRNAGRKSLKEEHHRQGHNNSSTITTAAPEKNPEPLFFCSRWLLWWQLCQLQFLSSQATRLPLQQFGNLHRV